MLEEVTRPRPTIDIEAIRRGLAERQQRKKDEGLAVVKAVVRANVLDHWEASRLGCLREGLAAGTSLAGLCRRLSASKASIECRIAWERLPDPAPPAKKEAPWDPGYHIGLAPGNISKVLASHGLEELVRTYGSKRTGPLGFDEREQALQMNADGFPYGEIAERFGLPSRAYEHDWTERERGQLKIMVERGMSADAIGEELGLTPDVVAERVLRSGWRFARGKYLRHERDRYKLERNLSECLALIKAKEDPGRIAHLLGVRFPQVRRYFRILRGRGHDFDLKRYKPSPWSPDEMHIPTIRAGYDLGVRAETVADTARELKAGQVKRVANQEGIAHPYWGKPWLQALRPESLMFHSHNGRLGAHLDDVLLCYPGHVGPDEVDRALRRYDEARRRFPDMRPWAHAQLEPRAERLRATLRRLEDREEAFQRQVRRALAG